MTVVELYKVMEDVFTIRIQSKDDSTIFLGHPSEIPVGLIDKRVVSIKFSLVVDAVIVVE